MRPPAPPNGHAGLLGTGHRSSWLIHELLLSSRAWDLQPPAEIIPRFQGALPVRGRGVWVLPGPLTWLKMGIFPRACCWYPAPLPGLSSIGGLWVLLLVRRGFRSAATCCARDPGSPRVGGIGRDVPCCLCH